MTTSQPARVARLHTMELRAAERRLRKIGCSGSESKKIANLMPAHARRRLLPWRTRTAVVLRFIRLRCVQILSGDVP